MGFRGLFEGWHLVVLIVLVIVIFGWKRLPDAARSLGRSMRIFRSEVDEMKSDRSSASSQTVRGDVVDGQPTPPSATPQASAADAPASATDPTKG